MELRKLRYFLAVADEESISRAAKTLFITQPTLSRQLMELEEELGVKLFTRGGRRISLTEEGMLLRRRAEEMIALEDKLLDEFGRQTEDLSGVISIGAAEANSAEILPQAISAFRAKYPAVTFDIYSDIATHVKERLDRGILDLGLLIQPGDIEKYDFIKLDVFDKCGVLMNAASPLACKESVSVSDLKGLPVLTSGRSEVRELYRNTLGKEYDELNVAATFNLINNAALFALQNKAYVLTIDGAVKNYANENLKFVPFTPEIRQNSYIVWKKYQPQNRTVSAFIEHIRNMLSTHSDS